MTTEEKRQQAGADAKLREELIALSQWIAFNLYGKHAYEFDPTHPYAACFTCRNPSIAFIHEWPHYPTDNAAALELLKLADTWLEPGYSIAMRGPKVWMQEQYSATINISATGTTLEHGICLFVKALWEYRQKNPLP